MPRLNFIILVTILLLTSCEKEREPVTEPVNTVSETFISAADLSSFPEIRSAGTLFFDAEGAPLELLQILKNAGINTVRLRLWHSPENIHSSLAEVKAFAQELKAMNFEIWLTIHYSDTWADPANQQKPAAWAEMSFAELDAAVGTYTEDVIAEIQPNIIQIGNEINAGLLHPEGNIETRPDQFKTLLNTAVSAVRSSAPESTILIHFAGHEGADWFFSQLTDVDYDAIGLSYYPIWHGKSLTDLEATMVELSSKFNKEVILAETAYPFTLEWNDWTTNIVGLESQLLPEFPATSEGQSDFVQHISSMIRGMDRGTGVCYWGGELVSWKGQQSENGSPWENQALFDFENIALPALEALGEK